MRDLFSRLHRTMGVDAAGNLQWSVGFDKEMEMETFDEVASALDAYLQGKNKRGVVVFDEFQQIVELGGEKMERRLRSAIQHQQQVTYVFVGSRKHMLEDLFSNPNRPFYRSGKIFPLLRIERERLYEYVKERFAEAEVAIADGVPDLVAEVTECHPYYTQYLCHVLYDVMENRRIEVDDIPNAVALLLRRESAAYMNIWDLLTQRQRQTLMILSETGTESPFRPEVLRQYDISQPSVVLRAIQSLKDKDLVDGVNGGYEITDLFFKKWIKKHISGTA